MIDAGFTCPNRDGRVGTGGCTFCRTDSYNPGYCHGTITQQIEAGKRFFAGKYTEMEYLAYFQAYSNTYAPIDVLRQRYEEALTCDEVVGIVIGTRPDCLDDEVIDLLTELQGRGHIVNVEIGAETMLDHTLRRINRGHTAEQTRDAIGRCSARGLRVCVHIIIGLPGEREEDILSEIDMLNELPIAAVKLHQLQILQGTPMAEEWAVHPEDFMQLTLENYATLVAKIIDRLRPGIAIERYSSSAPSHLLIAPRWGKKPYEVDKIIQKHIAKT